MRSCKIQLVTTVDTAEIIDTGSDNPMSDFSADSMEEETTGTNIEPNIVEVEIGDDFDPEFCWK